MDGITTGTGSISGSLSPPASMSGELSIPTYIDVDEYEGEYVTSPDFDGQTLPTKNKTLVKDITINPIQVESVSNIQGGRTVYIGGII